MLVTICKSERPDALRVLVMAPETLEPSLRPTEDTGELAFMKEELKGIHVDALIGTVPLVGRNSLADALRDGAYDVLHLITHSNCERFMLSDASASWHDLARLLSQHQIKLVISLTCDSCAFGRELIVAGVPAVICTLGEISNNEARVFTREFYHAWIKGIPRGAPFLDAVNLARTRLAQDSALLIRLLPDEQDFVAPSSVFFALQQLRKEQNQAYQKLERDFKAIQQQLIQTTERHNESLRALTAAVVHLTEVLTR